MKYLLNGKLYYISHCKAVAQAIQLRLCEPSPDCLYLGAQGRPQHSFWYRCTPGSLRGQGRGRRGGLVGRPPSFSPSLDPSPLTSLRPPYFQIDIFISISVLTKLSVTFNQCMNERVLNFLTGNCDLICLMVDIKTPRNGQNDIRFEWINFLIKISLKKWTAAKNDYLIELLFLNIEGERFM